jgi:hypothetical protein
LLIVEGQQPEHRQRKTQWKVQRGVRFDVGHTAQFQDNPSERQEMRLLTALQNAIDKALTEVAERLNAGGIGMPNTDQKG